MAINGFCVHHTYHKLSILISTGIIGHASRLCKDNSERITFGVMRDLRFRTTANFRAILP